MYDGESTDTPPDYTMIEAVRMVSATIFQAENELSALASAFSTTGNDRVAKNLEHIAASLVYAKTVLRRTHGQEIERYVRETTQASTNMINAALAGIAHGSGTKPVQLGSVADVD